MIAIFYIDKIKNSLIKGVKNKAGRNFLGRICIQGRGGGNKRKYRFLDFMRRVNSFGKILKIFRDPIRTAKICMILYLNGLNALSLVQQDVKLNTYIYTGFIYSQSIIQINNGYSLCLKYMPLFTSLSNIEFKPFGGAKIARAASVNCMMVSRNHHTATLKLNSKWLLQLSVNCMASMGRISSIFKNDIFIGKAGKNRALGYRPKVRGVAKNPCDHPHGGGNGKKSKPMIPSNAWHSVLKWQHTTNTKKALLNRRFYKKLI